MSTQPSSIFQARIMGALFLLAFIFYSSGRYFFDAANPAMKYVGAAFIVLNSVLVFTIGIFFRVTLRIYNSWVGSIYLAGRTVEALSLAAIVLSLAFAPYFKNDLGYFVGMLVLGITSVPMCWVLYKYHLTPRWLAIWGLVGYSIFSVGFLMEFFGKQWSMYLLGIGGLWEIVFACWLIMFSGRFQKIQSIAFLKNNLLIHAYSPNWIKDFTALTLAIDNALSGIENSIEHVGSTSVPNLDAKPIIDIDIIYSRKKDFEKIKLRLENIGYYHAGNQGIEGRDVFKRSKQETMEVLDTIQHHLYLCPAGSKALERHISTRNFLRKNDWAKQKYQQIKYEMAERAGEDRKLYAELKEQHLNDFIDSIIDEEKRTTN